MSLASSRPLFTIDAYEKLLKDSIYKVSRAVVLMKYGHEYLQQDRIYDVFQKISNEQRLRVEHRT